MTSLFTSGVVATQSRASDMAKTIVIANPSWLERHPVQIRRLLVRLIFSEATQHGWQVRMAGQRWRDHNEPAKEAKHHEAMTDAEWATLMGHAPS